MNKSRVLCGTVSHPVDTAVQGRQSDECDKLVCHDCNEKSMRTYIRRHDSLTHDELQGKTALGDSVAVPSIRKWLVWCSSETKAEIQTMISIAVFHGREPLSNRLGDHADSSPCA